MIYGHIKHSNSHKHLLVHPVWKCAFDALKELTPASPAGVTPLDGTKQFINVHTYETLPRNDCRFEHHHHTIDLQYIISGGEIIDWAPTWELDPKDSYLEAKDFQYLHPPVTHDAESTKLKMRAGYFAIFYPTDAHRPKVYDGFNKNVFKAVVKIDTSVFKQVTND